MNRYILSSDVPQPIRKILPSASDFIEIFKRNDRIDHYAEKFYQDRKLAFVIMCANPEYENEFEIPEGAEIRIPYPLRRVFNAWKIENQL